MAAFFANQHDVINLEGLVDFNLESLIDVIPAGIVKDAKDITVRFSMFFCLGFVVCVCVVLILWEA